MSEAVNGLSIRSSRTEDVGAVLELWQQAEATPGVTDTADDLRRVIRDGPAVVLVAEFEQAGVRAMSGTISADRCQGVLVGLAAGDRIGGPTRMAVRLAESLLECGGFDASDILNRYLACWRDGAFDTGPVSDRALALIAAGIPAPEATAQVHREYGAKMRDELPYRSEWCPCSGVSVDTVELQVREEGGRP